jgi:hypothetical protein
VNVRFNLNPDAEPHTHDHGVSEAEVHEAMDWPLLQTAGRDETTMKKQSPKRRKPTPSVDPNRYPKGWNRQRVQALADHYENQSDDQAIAELDAAFEDERSAMIQVPLDLLPKVQKLLAKRAG